MTGLHRLVDRWYATDLNVPRPRLIALIKLGEDRQFLAGRERGEIQQGLRLLERMVSVSA